MNASSRHGGVVRGRGHAAGGRCAACASWWAAPALGIVCACAGPSSGVLLYQGPDRPNDEATEGPAPPSDYNFGPLRRELDLDGDRRRDRVEFVSNGEITGVGEDTNHDGKIDRYQRIVHGLVLDETRDTDFDGILDRRSIDTNGDGKVDKEIQLLIPPLNGRPVPVLTGAPVFAPSK
jgi:hypothetical protein